ncbi:MAG: hypothetical protein FWG42_08495 [Clostridiales bacterium]|nr:hypothetical protein [Clostridiales bacterium]
MNHAFNTCGIESFIAVASVFCPEIVEVNEYIFISEFYNGGVEILEEQYGKDRKKIEQWVNSWSLADFFLQARDESVHVDDIIVEYGKAIQYFWSLRLKELFPDRNIIVELGDTTPRTG